MAKPFYWEWQESESSWKRYEDVVSEEIEAGFQSGREEVPLTKGYFATNSQYPYRVNFHIFMQHNISTGTVRPMRRYPPLDEDEVAVVAYSVGEVTVAAAAAADEECTLCLCELNEQPDTQGRDKIVKLRCCVHKFHSRCLAKFLAAPVPSGASHPSCPVCRAEMVKAK